jgi:hypothetical protein
LALNFDTVSDPLLRFALAAGLAVLVLSALMMLHILLLRLQLTLRQRRENRFTARWRPRFLESMQAIPLRLPRIARANWFIFLSLWNQYQESGSATARQRLKTLILQLRMDVAARKLLARGSIRVRLMAVLTLGHLGDRESWDKLHDLSHSPHPLLSLAAARALLLIDASAALALLLPDFTGRGDWSLAASRRCWQRRARTRSPPSLRPQWTTLRPSNCHAWSRCWPWRGPMTQCPGSTNCLR